MSDGNGIKVKGASADIITGVFDDSRAALLRDPSPAEMLAVLGQMSIGGNGSGTRVDDEGRKNRSAALTCEGGK